MTSVDRAEALIQEGGRVHLVGAAGVGMAGLARLLQQRGLQVSGCDLQVNRLTKWLSDQDIQVAASHDPAHISGSIDWLIRSTAVPESHPEVLRAADRFIPVLRRGEVLPALMRARTCIAVCGTHGKTTTTAMIAQILDCGFCVGGEIAGIDGVARDGELMVVEADESDGTIAGYTPDYAVITNIEYDHMEHHASEAAFIGCFGQLIENTKQKVFYCSGDPIACELCAGNSKCEPISMPPSTIPVSLPGRHNQWNAAAAMAVSRMWKSENEIAEALRKIQPVRRRFETVYEGRGIRIISDYAHHPTEIAALIQTALELKPKRLLGVFQPHRFTRTRALGPDFPPSFEALDTLWLVPVYAASEQPIEGGSSMDLFNRFPENWNGRLHYRDSLKSAWTDIKAQLKEGDILLVIGAGDIEQIAGWAGSLP